MSYSVYINSTDVSNYVVDIDKIPIFNSNKTGEPVCEGISLKLVYQFTPVINDGDEVRVKWNNQTVFIGYVDKYVKEDYNLYKVLKVKHFVTKLQNYSVRSDEFISAIRDVAIWTGAKTFNSANVNTITDRITIISHGFTSGDIVTVKSDGVLPGGLNENYQYEVTVIDANTIELEYPITGAPGAGIVDLTSGGSGTHYITSNIDFMKFVEWDNDYMPNVSLEWVLKAMFNMIGAELTVESPQFVFGVRTLNGQNIALDLNMLKVLGYGYATSTPTSDDWHLIINCYDLLLRLCQIFGWSLVHYGIYGDKKFALLRNASYSPFDFNSYLVEEYDIEQVYNEPDVVYGEEMFAPVTGGTSRGYYRTSTKTVLETHNLISAAIGDYQYPYINNLKLLVRQSTAPAYHISYNGGVEEYIPIGSMVQSYYDTYENDYELTRMTLKATSYADLLNHPVKEVWLDIKTNRVEVVQ